MQNPIRDCIIPDSDLAKIPDSGFEKTRIGMNSNYPIRDFAIPDSESLGTIFGTKSDSGTRLPIRETEVFLIRETCTPDA